MSKIGSGGRVKMAQGSPWWDVKGLLAAYSVGCVPRERSTGFPHRDLLAPLGTRLRFARNAAKLARCPGLLGIEGRVVFHKGMFPMIAGWPVNYGLTYCKRL
ncbi:hypothetical protein SBA3_910067 [Candidatus Sulfopaludibacter sp. SbA3]|nr:hypothetical protein SBA3_910067 [Candidatus Sulfopaludibacter sp. SbA3]